MRVEGRQHTFPEIVPRQVEDVRNFANKLKIRKSCVAKR